MSREAGYNCSVFHVRWNCFKSFEGHEDDYLISVVSEFFDFDTPTEVLRVVTWIAWILMRLLSAKDAEIAASIRPRTLCGRSVTEAVLPALFSRPQPIPEQDEEGLADLAARPSSPGHAVQAGNS